MLLLVLPHGGELGGVEEGLLRLLSLSLKGGQRCMVGSCHDRVDEERGVRDAANLLGGDRTTHV